MSENHAPPYKSRNRLRMEREIAQLERRINLLRARLDEPDIAPSLDRIMTLVAIHAQLPTKQIMSPSRRRLVADVRCVFVHLACVKYGHSKKSVARYLDRHHATIIYNLRAYNDKIFNTEFRLMAMALLHNVSVGLIRRAEATKAISA